MNSELVSIIMPAYNTGQFCNESISSVLAQTYDNWELIVVDDGSTDNTKDIVLNFQKAEPRIKYVYQHNGKQGKARNTGIERASGELIAFLDADDLWVPEMLEKQIKLIEEANADLVFSTVKYIDAQNNLVDHEWVVPLKTYEGTTGLYELIKGNCIPIFTVLVKKEVILNAGVFKTSNELQYGEDYDLWLRMLLHGAKFVCNDEPLAFYRKHELQSSKISKTKYLQIIGIINDLPVDLEREKKTNDMPLAKKIYALF